MKKTGFTLAEVLIALTIIGVVAAITVPTLIQRTNKQEYVTALQKAYSTLSQVTNQIIAENGSPKCNDGGWACSADEVYNLFKQYLNNAKECRGQSGCWSAHMTPSGGKDYTDWDKLSSTRKLIFADGMQVRFSEMVDKDCARVVDGDKICTDIWVDVNGLKGPNLWSRDLFAFVLKDNGIFPMGCKVECPAGSYTACACRVLREGAMNY